MRVLVCGGRDYQDTLAVGAYLGSLNLRYGISTIIEGGAPGTDTLARLFGEFASIPVESYPADWQKHGRAAGPIRNQRMLDEGRPDLVVAFPGGRGTADMVGRAVRAGIPVYTPTQPAPPAPGESEG